MATELFPAGDPDVLYLVDLSSYLLRAYHAVAPLSAPSGEPTHAVHGMLTMLERLFRERKPKYLAIAMDAGRDTFRREIYPEYKAHRPPAPDDLRVQLRRAEELVRLLGLPTFKQEGVEADDLIATLAEQTAAEGLKVVVVGADKDLMQLVSPRVRLWDTMRNKVFGREEVVERFGVPPETLGDLLALTGDTSDNIPGVPSVGPKTAAELLGAFGTIDGIFSNLEQVKKPKLRQTLGENEERARLSRRLVALKADCPIDTSRRALTYDEIRGRDAVGLERLYTELGFSRQLAALKKSETAVASDPPKSESSTGPEIPPRETASVPGKTAEESVEAPAKQRTVELLRDAASLRRWLDAEPDSLVALEFWTTHPERHRGPWVGLGLATAARAAYLPLSHRTIGAPAPIPPAEVHALLASREKLAFDDRKRSLVLLRDALPGAKLAPGHDVRLGSYLLDPEQNHGVESLSLRLGRPLDDYEARVKEGRRKRDFDELTPEEALPIAAARAAVIHDATLDQRERLDEASLQTLLDEVELPLADQLAEMEILGVSIDVSRLGELGALCEAELSALEKRAFEAAGHEFNVQAPRQLETILFDELGLTPLKRTKTSRSTDAATLEALEGEHPLPGIILEHRQIAKLKGTYIDALPSLVSKVDGRVHGAWEQAVAATGRLSSTEPNLQNIPIRSELGRKIRGAFVAPPGYVLVSADYSQIELRVLAHLSRDPKLVDAFRTNADVHHRTAMEIFEVAEDQVTREMRSQAKAVNFGVIYGQGEMGLSKAVGISRGDAAKFIATYFRRYEGVRTYMEATLAAARQGEAVRSILGRRRIVPDIGSANRARRLAAERIAMNMPIQGSAADILKLAMLALRTPVTPGTRMTLTVHDELVFEVPEREVEEAMSKIRAAMESAYELSVPLVVSVGQGPDWNSAH